MVNSYTTDMAQAHDPAPLPPWVRITRIVETREEWTASATTVTNDGDVAALVRGRLAAEEVEVMVVIALDGQSRVIAVQEIARGGAHGLVVTTREIYRAAVALGASGIVLCHCHPSGVAEPSPQDDAMTEVVRQAGEIIGVPLLDHVIVAGSRERFSYFASGRWGS